MAKIDEKVKGKRCSIGFRINPELRDAFRDKCIDEDINSSDLIRSWIEHFTWGYRSRGKKAIKDTPNEYVTTKIDIYTRRMLDKACSDMNLSMSGVMRSSLENWLKSKGYEVDKNESH